MTFNLLSILLSIAMMLTGATGLEADAPLASSLTIRDIYLDYNDASITLDPSLNAGVMTDNGTAVFDFSVAIGEESLFPMQLVVSEDAATLVVENAGKAFTIDAETLNDLVSEALDLDSLEMDTATSQAFDLLADSFSLGLNASSFDNLDAEAINAQVYETLEPVETTTGTAAYDDVEYEVTINRYVLDNDQLFELFDVIYASNEQLSSYYNQVIGLYNETLAMDAAEGEEPLNIETLKDIYAQMGMTMSMELTESTSADGVFTQATGSVTVESPDLPEPVVVYIDAYEVDGIVDSLAEFEYTIDDMTMYVGAMSYGDDTEQYFEVLVEVMPVESEELTEDDYADAVSFYINSGVTSGEDGSADYGFNAELSTYDGVFAIAIDGAKDVAGDSSTNFAFEYADDTDSIAFGMTLDHSTAAFDNAAEDLEPIAVTPETFESIEAEFEPVVESLLVDLQTLIEDESVTEMISAFTAINSMDYASTEVIAVDDYDETVNTELTFNEPEFSYLPEGMKVDDVQTDIEFNSVSCTIADEEYENIIYVYVYGDLYAGEITSYTLDADGALNAIENRIVTIESDEDVLFAEMQDGDVLVSLSCFGEAMTPETIGKLLSGMTY